MSYSTVERMTRPLKDDDRWTHRNNPDMRPEYLASLIAAFAAQLPADALRVVQAVESLDYVGLDEGDDTLVPSVGGTCARLEALYPLLGHNGQAPVGLLDFIATSIRSLVDMDADARKSLAEHLDEADWVLTICLEPRFASIGWYEPAETGAPNALASLGPPPPKNALLAMVDPEMLAAMAARQRPKTTRKRVSMRWRLNELDLVPRPRHRVVERLVWIPFSVLVTAAEICLEAKQRSTNGGPTLPDLAPGRADDEQEGDTAGPEMNKAAGPGSHNGLTSGQSETSPASSELANETHIEVDNDECRDRRSPVQRPGAPRNDRFSQPNPGKGNRHVADTKRPSQLRALDPADCCAA